MASDKITPHDDAHDGFHVVIDPKHQPPLPAEIVGDRRNTLGRRLSVVGIVGLALFFLISAYRQSVWNGNKPSPKPPVVNVMVSPTAPYPTPAPSPSPAPAPGHTVFVVVPPGSRGTSGPAPRASAAPRTSPSPPRATKPPSSPSASPSPTCFLPKPIPCLRRRT